jgi:hypothetical protein
MSATVSNNGHWIDYSGIRRHALCALISIIHALNIIRLSPTSEEMVIMHQMAEELRGYQDGRMLTSDQLPRILHSITRFRHLGIAIVDSSFRLKVLMYESSDKKIEDVLIIMHYESPKHFEAVQNPRALYNAIQQNNMYHGERGNYSSDADNEATLQSVIEETKKEAEEEDIIFQSVIEYTKKAAEEDIIFQSVIEKTKRVAEEEDAIERLQVAMIKQNVSADINFVIQKTTDLGYSIDDVIILMITNIDALFVLLTY